MVVLGILRSINYSAPYITEGFRLVSGTDRTPTSRLRVLNHGTEIEVAGGITLDAADTLQKLLDATPSIRIAQLNNVGGFVTEADRMGRLIAARRLSTFTARECVSACLLAFLGGKERLLGSKGRLGFHEASVGGVGGGVARQANEFFRRAFLQRGIPSDFVDRALSTSASGMWYPTID